MVKKIQPQLQCVTFKCVLLLYFIQYKIKTLILQNSAAESHFILLNGHVFKAVVDSNCKSCPLCLSAWDSMTPNGEIFVKLDDNFYKNMSTNSGFSENKNWKLYMTTYVQF